MKNLKFYIITVVTLGILSLFSFIACNEEETATETTININEIPTDIFNVGDTVTATITIVADGIKSFTYKKNINNEDISTVNVGAQLKYEAPTFTYQFCYELQKGDDVGELMFYFTVIDNEKTSTQASLSVATNLSMRSTFLKYDWHITQEEYTGSNTLTTQDSLKIYRFYNDDTYDVDLSKDYATDTHHYCYWVFKETSNNGDTIALLRLVRRALASNTTGNDEYYDFRITDINETEATMYWDNTSSEKYNIKRIFTSKEKGDFQPYGNDSIATKVDTLSLLDCSNINDTLLIFE